MRLSGTSCSAIALTQYICQKCGSGNSFAAATFLKRLAFCCTLLWAALGCRVSAFSTLSTSSTAPVLHCLKTSFNCRYLASCRFWYAICLGEECNRVTDAPESTRRLLGHISPQPSSVLSQARQ